MKDTQFHELMVVLRDIAESLRGRVKFTEEQIRYMRDRFLNWTLPEDFNPDGGITYKRSESTIKYNHPGPVGTNLLDAGQAEAMVRHMIEGITG